MSSSVLAIYLIHIHPCVFRYIFTPLVIKCGTNITMVIVTIVSICAICILVDKIRILIEHFSIKLYSLLMNYKNYKLII